MNRPIQWALRLLTCGCATAITLIGTAQADDSEIYITPSNAAPNIMLILDTSGSMGTPVDTQAFYDPATNYIGKATGNCASISGRYYYKTTDQGTPPACDSNDYVATADMGCALAATVISATGMYPGDLFVQWRTDGTNYTWRDVQPGTRTTLDCRKDGAPYPDSGGVSTSAKPAAYTNNIDYSLWRNNPGSGTSVTLYSANYVAYYAQFRTPIKSTRLKVMQYAAKNLLSSVSNVNVGLMRYSLNNKRNNGGGMVLAPVAPISENRQQLIDFVNGFIANGNTPLSETLYEAHQYFSGGSVFFGNSSQGCYTNSDGDPVCTDVPSAAASRVGGAGDTYASPLTQSCQNNYIVYLTDGEPTSDSETDDEITTLTGLTCDGDSNGDGAPDDNGSCLGALSQYMYDTDLNDGLDSNQNITSYYIGFGDDFGGTSNAAFDYLSEAAKRGNGKAYQAGDLSELTRVFTDIFNSINAGSSTMSAPTAAVNAFNRTRTLNDLYLSVFQPTNRKHWPGNVKKFRLGTDDTTLLAKGNAKALDANGQFLDTISDYWSATANDGSRVELGGAARKIPNPATRKVYTYLGANPGTSQGVALVNTARSETAVRADNAKLTDAELLTSASSVPSRTTLINWARGADVDNPDEDRQGDPRFDMGDPMHSQPAVVIYGGSTRTKNPDDAVAFTATNDGYLHAFSTTTGEELWSFIPKEMLSGLKALYNNDYTAGKSYALDGDLRVLKYDTNGDGIVDPSDADRVLLFFSTGRNRTVSRYYALDVTYKQSPKFLWSIGAETLPGLGQAWSRPTITRVNVSGKTQNTQKLVLIFGGGYDPLEEAGPFVPNTSV
jgi:type IV pilus assembly protein PilY1